LRFSRKRLDGSAPNFFQGLEKNTCLLQLALKSTAPMHPVLKHKTHLLCYCAWNKSWMGSV